MKFVDSAWFSLDAFFCSMSLLLETLCLDWIRSNYVVELDMN